MTPRKEPAFPTKVIEEQYDDKGKFIGNYTFNYSGMTLRDWFAGMAMQSFITDDITWGARMAYEAADAMLAEREKANGKGEGA